VQVITQQVGRQVAVNRLVAEKEHGGNIFALVAHGTLRLMS
jgi:hypothetical protein